MPFINEHKNASPCQSGIFSAFRIIYGANLTESIAPIVLSDETTPLNA
jgi:hypothetical protein